MKVFAVKSPVFGSRVDKIFADYDDAVRYAEDMFGVSLSCRKASCMYISEHELISPMSHTPTNFDEQVQWGE